MSVKYKGILIIIFGIRIRTECSEHVNLFIDAHMLSTRTETYVKRRFFHWKTALKLNRLDEITTDDECFAIPQYGIIKLPDLNQ